MKVKLWATHYTRTYLYVLIYDYTLHQIAEGRNIKDDCHIILSSLYTIKRQWAVVVLDSVFSVLTKL